MMQREFVTYDDGHNGGYPHHHDVVWMPDQLRKYRIRKAGPDERPPWWWGSRTGLVQARWWVYEPGRTDPSACWLSQREALHHVNDLICHAIVGPYLKEAEQ